MRSFRAVDQALCPRGEPRARRCTWLLWRLDHPDPEETAPSSPCFSPHKPVCQTTRSTWHVWGSRAAKEAPLPSLLSPEALCLCTAHGEEVQEGMAVLLTKRGWRRCWAVILRAASGYRTLSATQVRVSVKAGKAGWRMRGCSSFTGMRRASLSP